MKPAVRVLDEERGETLPTLLSRSVAANGERIALVDGDAVLSWTALAERVEGAAAQLASLGIGRGDRVAIWLPNGADYITLMLAAARRGACVVHVNTRLGAAEVGDLLQRTGATVLATRTDFPPVDFIDVLSAIDPARLGALGHVLVDGVAVLPHNLEAVAPAFRGAAADLSDPHADFAIYTTGGTTAKPKLVVHRQHSIANHAAAVAAAIGIDQTDAVLLAAVPFCGTFGNIALMAAIAGSARIVCMAQFDGEAGRALIHEHGITHLVGDDRMMARLADAALARGERYDGVRFAGVAGFGADAAQGIARSAEAGLAPHAIYGSSEVQALFAIGAPEGVGWGAVRPVDAAAGYELVGEAGELALYGPSLFDRYLDDPAASAAAMTDGLFRTGDRATLSVDGFVFEGRIGDVLRLGGFLVSPLEIEAFLQAQPGVAGAQVVGVEAAHGPAAFAFAVPAAGAVIDEAALIARCRAMLARYKVPVRIVEVAEFPTSIGPNGPKISRADLRRIAIDTIANDFERI